MNGDDGMIDPDALEPKGTAADGRPDVSGIGTIDDGPSEAERAEASTKSPQTNKATKGKATRAEASTKSPQTNKATKGKATRAASGRTRAPKAPQRQGDPTNDGAWRARLQLDRYKNAKPCFLNVLMMLRHSQPWAGRFAYNAMTLTMTLDGQPVTDETIARIRERLDGEWAFTVPLETLTQAIQAAAFDRSSHPVRDYLEGLPAWDRVPRIDRIASEVLGADGALVASFVTKTMIAAVARAFEPGCKVDTVLCLIGEQSLGKSRFFRELASAPFFSDTPISLHEKDGFLTLHAAWILEWAELESILHRREASDVKRFLTSSVDVFRPPYARAVAPHPRSGIIVATSNEKGMINDPTGSRRLWIMTVTKRVDAAHIRELRDLWWSEAVALYRASEHWWLTLEAEGERAESAIDFEQADLWEEKILPWVAGKQAPFSMSDLATLCLMIDTHAQSSQVSRRIAGILRKHGFDNAPLRPAKGMPKARLWRRVAAPTTEPVSAAAPLPAPPPERSLFDD
ncbi:MAG: VapE domain-containing protein [Polyangiales bacterium]